MVAEQLAEQLSRLSKCSGYNFLTVSLPGDPWFQIVSAGKGLWELNIHAPRDPKAKAAVLDWLRLQGCPVATSDESSILASVECSIPVLTDKSLSLLRLLAHAEPDPSQLRWELYCDPTIDPKTGLPRPPRLLATIRNSPGRSLVALSITTLILYVEVAVLVRELASSDNPRFVPAYVALIHAMTGLNYSTISAILVGLGFALLDTLAAAILMYYLTSAPRSEKR